jgi:hypothetical protein
MFEDSELFTNIGLIIWLGLTILIFISILGGQDNFKRIFVYIILWVANIFVFNLWDEVPFLKD